MVGDKRDVCTKALISNHAQFSDWWVTFAWGIFLRPNQFSAINDQPIDWIM